ncbi:MAG TPA: hypothetical protein PLR62_03180, partial [Candidatus Woesebacteria bacterium]|nr:hypothetical protein [Candidatus Woesebacteria bacterium]
IDVEIKKNSLVIFVNPSTPDGKYYELEELMKKWMENSCTILIDESFFDRVASNFDYCLSNFMDFWDVKILSPKWLIITS